MRLINKLIFILSLISTLGSCDLRIKSDNPNVDIVIEADHILTMNSKNEILIGSALAIKDGIILDIDAKEIIQNKYEAKITIAGEQRIIMPGTMHH